VRVHHLALRVADLERSIGFYAGVLGLAVVRRWDDEHGAPRSAWLRAGSVVLMLERRLAGAGVEQGSGHVLALAVDDLGQWEARLHRHAVALDGRSEHTLYVRDPDGHRVGLSTYPFDFLD
jgi:hypothetical protein